MGIKDNFTQAMKELTNPRPSDARKEVRDVASYMNDTADAQPTEPVQPVQSVQNTQPSENKQPEQQTQQSVKPETAGNGFTQQEQAQDFSQRIARDMNEQYTHRTTRLIRMYAVMLLRRHLRITVSQAARTDLRRAVQTTAATTPL